MSRLALLGFGWMVKTIWENIFRLSVCLQVLVLRPNRQSVPPDILVDHRVRVRGILDFSSQEQSGKEKQTESIH